VFKSALEGVWQAIIRTFAFITKEIRTIIHQPRLVFTLILGPFLILLLFGVGYRNTTRTLHTLYVVPEGSPIEGFVEQYAQSLGDRITFAGITHDADEADAKLRTRQVDLVVVTPADPMTDWQGDEQSVFTLYHGEIDPIEATYVEIIGQRYAEAINREVLALAVEQSQGQADEWVAGVSRAKEMAGTVRAAMDAGDQLRAQDSAASLRQELDVLTVAVGSGLALVNGLAQTSGGGDNTAALLAELESLQANAGAMSDSANNNALAEGATQAAEVEASLTQLDGLLTQFQALDARVVVAPFRSESVSITAVDIEPMHFYVPGVIALLLQHLAITLAGLSIIQEKDRGAMELFRAAPVSAFEMLVGKYSSYILLIGGVAAVLTALIVLVLGVPQLGTWGNYVLIVLAVLLASLGVGFHISLSARSDSQAVQYGMLTLLAAIFFSGFFLPLYRLVPAVRALSWLLPATYGTVLLQDQMLRGQPPQALLLGALLVFGGVLFLLAWWRLGRQMVKESKS
jgi:ABC-2 type transport system permease protein